MNASNVRTSSTPSSSLRPRTKRLISGLDEGDEVNYDPATAPISRIASPVPSPFDSRAVSPIPNERLPRTSSHGRTQNGRSGTSSLGRADAAGRQRRQGNESPLAGLWGNSWSTLQNMASDLLSGDAAADTKDKPRRTKKPLSSFRNDLFSNTQSSAWGPQAPGSRLASQDIGGGTRDEQIAALRAQKRKAMLTGQDPTSYADTLGRYKRRISDDHAASAPPGDHEDRDALVYVHHVKKDDTLPGITIRYNCSANTLRKANRMWPNDTIQSRPTLILPVDACGVKGRPVQSSEAIDLLSSDSDALAAGLAEEVPCHQQTHLTNGDAYARNRTNSASTDTTGRRPSSSVAASSLDSEPPWFHDSWVLLPGAEKPTEIARLSRRSLGYFPRARRKSQLYSDFNTTPSHSLDLTREHTNTSDLMPGSPYQQESASSHQRPGVGRRRHSNASTGYFPTYLAGPGGVGTMNRNVRFPGPAQDGLNKVFAKHLPDVAPPSYWSHQGLLAPELPGYSDDPPTASVSGTGTPTTGGRSQPMNLENVGGAIEGWMRKVAANAKTAMEGSSSAEQQQQQQWRQKSASARGPTGGVGVTARKDRGRGVEDLIEMTDEFEIGGDDEEEDDEAQGSSRGRKGSVIHVGPRNAPSSSTGFYENTGTTRERSSRGTTGGKGAKSWKDD
ncbi:hypothetical protein KC361_g754 [Hortaea werneckii]|nr:hypothetical protein KC361_g754 [Hortaea werneckii]